MTYELLVDTGDGNEPESLVDNFARHVLGGEPILGPPGRSRLGIRCLVCGSLSWNTGDVVNRYCARCRKFHDDA